MDLTGTEKRLNCNTEFIVKKLKLRKPVSTNDSDITAFKSDQN